MGLVNRSRIDVIVVQDLYENVSSFIASSSNLKKDLLILYAGNGVTRSANEVCTPPPYLKHRPLPSLIRRSSLQANYDTNTGATLTERSDSNAQAKLLSETPLSLQHLQISGNPAYLIPNQHYYHRRHRFDAISSDDAGTSLLK